MIFTSATGASGNSWRSRRSDRLVTGRMFLLGVAFIGLLASPSAAQYAPDSLPESLLAFAVNVHQTPMQSWGPGYGIYLGKGLFITAAHVAGITRITRPKVTIAGQEYPTKVVKEGSFEGTDLTLLSVEEDQLPMRFRMRHNSLCKDPPWPGEPVVTVVPEAIVRSQVIAPERIPLAVRRFSTAIVDVAQTGNSGSGVFDLQHRCLLGIMSRKISKPRLRADTGKVEVRDIAKYFVPSTEISAFLPADPKF